MQDIINKIKESRGEIVISSEAEALCEKGDDYYYGRNGKSKDYEKAVEYYRKTAEQGLARAQLKLGYCYENGQGIEKSAHEAV